MAGAGLIPAIHSAASFTVAPGRRGYPPGPPAAGVAWRGGPSPSHQPYPRQPVQAGGYFMAAPVQAQGLWAGHPMAVPQWGAPAGGAAMRYGPLPPQAPGAAPEAAPGQQAPSQQAAMFDPQQALFYQQLQAQQQQSYMQQAAYYQQAQAQAQMAAAAHAQVQAQAQGLHADEPLFAREPMPQVPIALDASGRPFKACPCPTRGTLCPAACAWGLPHAVLTSREAEPCLAAPATSRPPPVNCLPNSWLLLSCRCDLPQPATTAAHASPSLLQVFHGVVARSIRKPERYQGDGRPAWSR